MKLTVHPSLILWISVLFYLKASLLIPFLLAAALHEAGHALMLHWLDKPIRSLHLAFSGARMIAEPMTYREELLAAAAGPMASLLIALLLPLWPELGLYSLILGLFNLLPVPGLDGGRILRCLMLMVFSQDTASWICRTAAIVTALVLWGGAVDLSVVLHFGLWPPLLAGLLLCKALIPEDL